MIIKTKYNINDLIHYKVIDQEIGGKEIKCDFCNGSGKIQGNNQIILDCPVCHGKATVYEPVYYEGTYPVKEINIVYKSASMGSPEIIYRCSNGMLINEATDLAYNES